MIFLHLFYSDRAGDKLYYQVILKDLKVITTGKLIIRFFHINFLIFDTCDIL